MVRCYGLRDDQWEKSKALLPGREDTVGVTAKDNRLLVAAVIYRYRAGIPWRDLPERFGDWHNIARRAVLRRDIGDHKRLCVDRQADAACARRRHGGPPQGAWLWRHHPALISGKRTRVPLGGNLPPSKVIMSRPCMEEETLSGSIASNGCIAGPIAKN
jgi:transposase